MLDTLTPGSWSERSWAGFSQRFPHVIQSLQIFGDGWTDPVVFSMGWIWRIHPIENAYLEWLNHLGKALGKSGPGFFGTTPGRERGSSIHKADPTPFLIEGPESMTRIFPVLDIPILPWAHLPSQEVRIAVVAKYTEKDVEGKAYTGLPRSASGSWQSKFYVPISGLEDAIEYNFNLIFVVLPIAFFSHKKSPNKHCSFRLRTL